MDGLLWIIEGASLFSGLLSAYWLLFPVLVRYFRPAFLCFDLFFFIATQRARRITIIDPLRNTLKINNTS